jgi:maltooligosyltrehalose trehalohydrolase
VNRFSVWAPNATRVDVDLQGDRVPMSSDNGGWWWAEVPEAEPGDRYRFVLDSGEPLPDPRSAWQPDGIDGPSAIYDHDYFPWTDGDWKGTPLASAVVYELHVGTFTPEGTFDSAILRLDHLVELGVTAVELLPIAEFSGDRGWGYDGVLLYAPHHAYGGPEGLKRLVDACHQRGLAVVMDVVYNHLGPSGNHLAKFGPYFTDRYNTPWGDAVNFDGPGSDEVRRFFVDNALMWLRDYHIDGLRLDAVHAIVDTSAMHILEEIGVEVQALSAHVRRTLFLVAESDLNDPRIVRRREVGGYSMDAQWSDDFHHALHVMLTGERSGYYADFHGASDVATALRKAYVYDGEHAAHRGRRHGRSIGDLAGWRFLGYLQNHDQIGNRAMGERSSMLMSPSRLYVAAALVITAPFVPMLFQGEEWGASTPFQYFTDHHDPELGRAVSDGRRREFAAFGWKPEDVPDPQDPATFERSKLDWDEVAEPDHAALLDWHRRLIALRAAEPSLTDGRFDRVRVDYDAGSGWLVVQRLPVVVAVNVGEAEALAEVPEGLQLLMASSESVSLKGDEIRLPPDSVAILQTHPHRVTATWRGLGTGQR